MERCLSLKPRESALPSALALRGVHTSLRLLALPSCCLRHGPDRGGCWYPAQSQQAPAPAQSWASSSEPCQQCAQHCPTLSMPGPSSASNSAHGALLGFVFAHSSPSTSGHRRTSLFTSYSTKQMTKGLIKSLRQKQEQAVRMVGA